MPNDKPILKRPAVWPMKPKNDRVEIRLHSERGNEWRAYAVKCGMSLTRLIEKAMDDLIHKELETAKKTQTRRAK